MARPLTDAELLTKVDTLTEPVLGPGSAATMLRGVDGLDTAADFTAVIRAARPRRNGGIA
jgi:hypothetical protein